VLYVIVILIYCYLVIIKNLLFAYMITLNNVMLSLKFQWKHQRTIVTVRCYLWVRTCCRSTSYRCPVISDGQYFTTRHSKQSGIGSFLSWSSILPSVLRTLPPSFLKAAGKRTVWNPVNLLITTGNAVVLRWRGHKW